MIPSREVEFREDARSTFAKGDRQDDTERLRECMHDCETDIKGRQTIIQITERRNK